MSKVDPQQLSLRLLASWVLALTSYWFCTLIFLWPSIKFAISNGIVMASHNLRAFGEPALFCILGLMAGIAALLEKQWYRYFLYLLTAAVVARWFWHTWNTMVMMMTSLHGYSLFGGRKTYNFLFAEAGPALALVVLTLIAVRISAHIRCESDTHRSRSDRASVLSISPWMMLGGVLLLVWLPHVEKNIMMIVIGLPGIRGYDLIVLLLYVLAVLSYPVVYIAAVVAAKRKIKVSGNEKAAILALNLPLINIVVGTASWLKVLGHDLDFR
jgi:hypothetical protein